MEECKKVAVLVLLYLLWCRHCRYKRRPRWFRVRDITLYFSTESSRKSTTISFRWYVWTTWNCSFDTWGCQKPLLMSYFNRQGLSCVAKYRSALRPEISLTERLAINIYVYIYTVPSLVPRLLPGRDLAWCTHTHWSFTGRSVMERQLG